MIELDRVGKAYPARQGVTHAVGEVSLTIGAGEFVSIVGPSGCGKSTLLNMIAGFLPPTAGEIRVDGQRVNGQVPPRLGYIFQKDTLLPWFSVRKNVALGLKFQGVAPDRIASRVAELLELGHLADFADAYPHQLSGGMRRRVALLMSLAVEPRILLLDEPFGALDTHTKTHLHRELIEIWRTLGQTIVMVTHDLTRPSRCRTASWCCPDRPAAYCWTSASPSRIHATCSRCARRRSSPPTCKACGACWASSSAPPPETGRHDFRDDSPP